MIAAAMVCDPRRTDADGRCGEVSKRTRCAGMCLLLFSISRDVHAQAEEPPVTPALDAGADTMPIAPAGPADTAPTCEAPRYVLLLGGPSALDGELFDEIDRELGTELQDRGLSVCRRAGGERGPAAVVSLSRVDGKHVLIDIDDRATDKRISRAVSIGSLPLDGRALAVAVAIDELLRASWAELILRQADQEPAPRARSRTPRRSTERRASPDRKPPVEAAREPEGETQPITADGDPWSMAASLLYQHTSTRWDALGGAVRGQYTFAAPFRFGAGLRAYHANRVSDGLGSIAANGIGTELSGGACLGRYVRMCTDARISVDYVAFDGRRNRSLAITSRDASGVPVVAELALSGQWPSEGPIFGAAELSAGYAIHGVNADSDGRHLLGLSGQVLGASLSVGVRP